MKIKIATSPIILCRVKNIDYRDAIYAYPKELSEDTITLIKAMMDNGNALNQHVDNLKIFINDGIHCIIGKCALVKSLIKKEGIDCDLDKMGGRAAWGFIGCVIKTSDFIVANSHIDIPEEFITIAYEKYYQDHWLDCEPAKGPFDYGYNDYEFNILSFDRTQIDKIKMTDHYILEGDSYNESLYIYAIDCTLKGNNIAFCTNADYNANKLISSKKVQIVTARESMLPLLRSEIKRQKDESVNLSLTTDDKKEQSSEEKKKSYRIETNDNNHSETNPDRKEKIFKLNFFNVVEIIVQKPHDDKKKSAYLKKSKSSENNNFESKNNNSRNIHRSKKYDL
ncbi:MAG: hypothetical protein R3Y68_02140 [Rikenellaceae bacterium]